MKKMLFGLCFAVVSGAWLPAQEVVDPFAHLTIGLPMHEIVWDPHAVSHVTEHRLLAALYEGLVVLDPTTLMPVPALAETWSVSEDGLTYTFTLRANLRFSDGADLSAISFYRSFLRLIDPVSVRANAELLYAVKNVRAYSTGEPIDRQDLGFVAVDERTFVITLEHPAPYFLEILSHPALSPISQSQLPAVWDKPMMVVYSGPYLVGAVGENTVTLKRNRLYWDAASVEVKEISVRFYDNAFTATEHFNDEEVDWINSVFDPTAIRRSGRMVQYTRLYASQYYFFTQQEGMYANTALQQALVQLLPLHHIREAQSVGLATLTPTIPNYPLAATLQTDPVEAYLTLAALGFPRGRGLAPISILAFDRDDQVAHLMADVWRATLEGVEVRVVYADDETSEHGLPTVMSEKWLADYLDPLAFLSQWRSDARMNQSTFNNSEFDRLIEISHHQEGKERLATLSAGETLLLQSGVVIPIAHVLEFNLIDLSQVKGFSFNPLGRQSFKALKLVRPAFDELGLLL